MKKQYKMIKTFSLFLMISLMSISAISQDVPEYDKISTSAGTVELHFIGHGSLMFKVNNNTVIYIDPVRSSGNYDFLPKADIILVTHEHGDHLDAELIGKLKKQGTFVFCNKKSSETIPWAMVMTDGSRQEIKGIVIEAVPAYNIVHESAPGQPYHPKGVGVGYVLTIGDKRIYVAILKIYPK